MNGSITRSHVETSIHTHIHTSRVKPEETAVPDFDTSQTCCNCNLLVVRPEHEPLVHRAASGSGHSGGHLKKKVFKDTTRGDCVLMHLSWFVAVEDFVDVLFLLPRVAEMNGVWF